MEVGINVEGVQKLQNQYKKNLVHKFNKQGVEGGKQSKESINVEGGIFWKKLVHKSHKQGVEGGKI